MKKTLIAFATLAVLSLGAASAAKRYPSNHCIVTDNELGSMGKVVTKVYDGQEVKFCCKPCVAKFDKNPAKYLGKIR